MHKDGVTDGRDGALLSLTYLLRLQSSSSQRSRQSAISGLTPPGLLCVCRKSLLQAGLSTMHDTAKDAQRLMADIKPLIAKAEAIAAEVRMISRPSV